MFLNNFLFFTFKRQQQAAEHSEIKSKVYKQS
jgi:hypothetical protein